DGVILIAAGAYQLTPFKGDCLTHCRSPLGFLMSRWRDGTGGALRMGIEHGTYCLGCCWALMCVLFVVGVMNLVLVAMAIFLLIEKTAPAGPLVARVAGVAMITAGALAQVFCPRTVQQPDRRRNEAAPVFCANNDAAVPHAHAARDSSRYS